MQGIKALGQGVKTFGMMNDVQSVIGKPMDTFTLPNPQYKAQTKTINWKDFNYPPLIRVVHYNPVELPTKARSIAYCLNITFLLVVIACLLNFVDTCIIVSTSTAPWKWAVQSLLHCVLIPGLAFVVFYVGYRRVAEEDTRQLGQFTLGQISLIFVSLYMSLVSFGCVNGLFKLMVITDYVNYGSAWRVAIFVESSMWLACTAMAVATLVWMRQYDHHADVLDKPTHASHV